MILGTDGTLASIPKLVEVGYFLKASCNVADKTISSIILSDTVYTTTTPRVNHVFNANLSRSISSSSNGTVHSPTTSFSNGASPVSPSDKIKPAAQAARAALNIDQPSAVLSGPHPLNTAHPSQKSTQSSNIPLPQQIPNGALLSQRSLSMALIGQQGPGEESPVMNETLSVIDEHITDMNTPRSSLLAGERRGTNDSGSDYSNHIDHRLSYIVGHETDEEERDLHTRKEVVKWNPSQVAECLGDLGVETRHCEIFMEQEISGEVLLAMDQASVFLKEFDLGLVGRRLRTWHKIKAFQDEVRANDKLQSKPAELFRDDGSRNDGFAHAKNGSPNGVVLPQIPSFVDRSGSEQQFDSKEKPASRPSPSPSPQFLSPQRAEANSTPASSIPFASRPGSPRRPSAASIREYNHSRRHSAVDFSPSLNSESLFDRSGIPTPTRNATSAHRKVPSLDRNWTITNSILPATPRPKSAIDAAPSPTTDADISDAKQMDQNASKTNMKDHDRGYTSGGDSEPKRIRNVLKKRDGPSASHSRQAPNKEDPRRSLPASRRHSRFSSVDSIRDTVSAMAGPATKLYHGNSVRSRQRNSSVDEVESSLAGSSKNEITSPTVTKLEYEEKPRISLVTRTSSPKINSDRSSNASPASSTNITKSSSTAGKPRMGLRAISDAVTGSERAIVASPSSIPSPIRESSIQSPTRTGSTTPSGTSHSLDFESTDASSKGTSGAPAGLTPTNGTVRRKTKKDTSAYVRGLEPKTPQEQMIGCDYSGWMKKKASNLIKTWKPRLFVLRGRRLSYYYSENDTQEKGLIDISFHRVLPADSDFITGFHAAVTGAKSSPVSPSNTQTVTLAAAEAAALPESTLHKSAGDGMFIFKLVPPRSGLSRAVNFTKPTVHYFAVENIAQGRLWMAALMKATIDRDETKPITTTYQQKTISLIKARAMRHRPPALMGLDEKKVGVEEGPKSDETGLNIQGMDLEYKRTGSLSVESNSQMASSVEVEP